MTGLRYPFTLTKAGFALTFPLNMESPPSNLEKQPTVEELAESGPDLAKINLRSAAYRSMSSLRNTDVNQNLTAVRIQSAKFGTMQVFHNFEHFMCFTGFDQLPGFG